MPTVGSLLEEGRMRRSVLLGFTALFALGVQAQATWKPEYASNPPEVQEWYRNAELTSSARVRFPFKKCCDHADVVKTKFAVNKVDGRDEWFYEDSPGHMKRIPDDIIHWGKT